MAELAADKVKLDEKALDHEDTNADSSDDEEKYDSDLGKDLHAADEQKPLHPKLLAVNAVLEMKNLWDEFNELGTEMIVTKVSFQDMTPFWNFLFFY